VVFGALDLVAASTKWGLGAVLFTPDKAFFLYESWTDEEKAMFDIAELEAIAYDMAFKFFPAVGPEHFAKGSVWWAGLIARSLALLSKG
jgi:hypothetical protein